MIRTLDFWLGSGPFAGWYVVFYLGIAAGYLPYVPQVAERLGQAPASESLGVFVIVLMCWGGPLLLFSIVHAIMFLVGGGDSFPVRLLWGLGLLGAGAIAVLAAAFLAAGSRTAGMIACHAILAGLLLANLSVLWAARHAAPVRTLFT